MKIISERIVQFSASRRRMGSVMPMVLLYVMMITTEINVTHSVSLQATAPDTAIQMARYIVN